MRRPIANFAGLWLVDVVGHAGSSLHIKGVRSMCHRAVVSKGLCVIGPLCHRVRVRRSTNKVYKLS